MDGATIGQYRVTGVIGRGGMGTVYAAEHALLGRPAAIKVLLPELSQKQDVVARFFNEARAATAIRHPGIVEIYDFGWAPDGAAYLVMERLEGETLARRSARGLLPWSTALAIARQITGALGAAHSKGIVHRDLKPENVFLVLDPEVPGGERIKLLDFGIAKLAGDSAPAMNVTRTGAVIGTPTYMAPEQCRGVAVDHRADLYALGCCVFELCSGRPPFVGEGTGDVLAAHIHVRPPTLASLNVAVPAEVERLVGRLLAKLPAERLQTAEQVIRAIDAITAERATAVVIPSTGVRAATASPSVTTLSAAASVSRELPAARRQIRSVAIVAGTAAAITVVVVALAMRRSDEAAAPAVAAAARESIAAPVPQPPAASAAVAAAPSDRAPLPSSPQPAAPEPAAGVAAAAPEPASAPPPSVEPPAPVARQIEPPAIAPRPPEPPASVEIALDSSPAGAQVTLAGKLLGKTPFRGTIPRGAARLRLIVHLDGYLDRTVIIHPDHAITERIKLNPSRDESVNPYK